MTKPRFFACVSFLAAIPFAWTQSLQPSAYVITEGVTGGIPGTTTTIYRDGAKVLMETDSPAQGATPKTRSLNFIDLQTKRSFTWDPDANPPTCDSGTVSGDWGDPFGMTAQLNASIAKGELKAAGVETLAGIPAQVYSGSSAQGSTKAWLDKKTGLVVRVAISAPGAAPLMMVDIKKVSFATPPASLFALPRSCAGVRAPATAADKIGEETGDDPANYVNGMYGPGSKQSCSVVLRVVNAKTLTPIAHIQVAIDTAYVQENPPHYEFGVHEDGSTTYSGGHVLEITNRAHNGTVRLGIPPPYFMIGVNLVHPGHSGDLGLVYRQCFAPTTVLLYVVKDYGMASESGDFLWVKAGKSAVPPAL